MKIGKNVAMLNVPHPAGSSVYPVLTWDSENLVLIDAGFPEQAELFKSAIAGEGFDVENLTHIIITHQDLDHVGSLRALLDMASKAKVLVHTDEVPYLDGREVPVKLAKALANIESMPPEHHESIRARKIFFDDLAANVKFETVNDRDVLHICGGIEIMHTPGHTPGHIVLHLQETGIFVCGDALNIKDGQVTGPNPIHTQDFELATKYYEQIVSYPKSGLVAYHGGILND